VRDDAGPVYVERIPARGRLRRIEHGMNSARRWFQSWLPFTLGVGEEWRFKRKYPFARKPTGVVVDSSKPVDFNRGPAELAQAIRHGRPCRLSAKLGLHIVDLVEAMQYPDRFGGKRIIDSTFDPIQPLPWNA